MRAKYILLLITATLLLVTTICRGQEGYFDSLSTGVVGPRAYVLSLAMKDSTSLSPVYAGGYFKVAGRVNANNIAEWVSDSTPPVKGKWNALGSGTDSDVCAVAMYGKYLYAGGKFDSAGGVTCSYIARWDTALFKWDSLLGKLNGNVYALCVYNNILYVGGDFTIADGDTVNRIAAWNGSTWISVGKGFDTGAVYVLAVCNDTLYAGGSFMKSNGVQLNHIAKLSGNAWDSLGLGTNNTVYALAENHYDGYVLAVGGAFTKSGGIKTNYISTFNYLNHSWDSIESGVNDTVRALNAGSVRFSLTMKDTKQGFGQGATLVIGGSFDSADGYPCNHIGLTGFMGYSYIAGLLGGGDGTVYALANPYSQNEFSSGDNYIGGSFKTASADSVNNITYMYMHYFEGIQNYTNENNTAVYPNPSTGIFTLKLLADYSKSYSVNVYNVTGQKIYSKTMLNTPQITIDLSAYSNGVYFYRIIRNNGGSIASGKVLISR